MKIGIGGLRTEKYAKKLLKELKPYFTADLMSYFNAMNLLEECRGKRSLITKLKNIGEA